MNQFGWGRLLSLSIAATVLPVAAFAQAPSTKAPTSLGQSVTLPQPYESTVASIGALATGAQTALQSYKSDARTLAVRLALFNAISAKKEPIDLSKDNTLLEYAMLCTPRVNYVTDSVYLNYLNTLVQNINAVSIKSKAATDIPTALKILLATTNYQVVDKVGISSDAINKLTTLTDAQCKQDLGSYAADFYGQVPGGGQAKSQALASPPAVNMFAFLGPVGALVDTFLSILQPVLIDWATLADETRRQDAIIDALTDQTIQQNINKSGPLLAAAMDDFSAKSRYALVGAFVEQLVLIRDTKIDLSKVEDCGKLQVATDPTSGIPNSTFVGCYGAAWSKIQKGVANLTTYGDNYDTLADKIILSNGKPVTAKQLFQNIMADWAKIAEATKDGKGGVYTQAFLEDLTEFIALAQDIATAASKSNLSALDKAAAAAAK